MRLLGSLALTSCLAAMAFAAEPVGTASSSATFDVNGVRMRSGGVASWPVVAGDEVRSGNSGVVLRFQDGSRVMLSEQSRVKVVRSGDALTVNLLGGEAQFSLSEQSALQVLNQGRQVDSRTGSISTRTQAVVGQNGGPRTDIVRVPPAPLSTK